MHKFTKKRIAIGALGLLVVVGAAVAYFTTQGSGTGEAEVGTNEGLGITASMPGELLPGTSLEATFTIHNESQGHQYVNTISLAQKEGEPWVEAFKGEEEKPLCKPEWFAMNTVSVHEEVVPGPTILSGHKGEFKFLNQNTNQDECKEVHLVAHFTSE